jgi:hypothetical protein
MANNKFSTPSLFLPYVRGVNRSPVINVEFVIETVENLLQARGSISRVDHRPTKDGLGSMCFIHFDYWPRTRVATEMLIKLNSGERNIKIWHSDRFFWKVALNTGKTTNVSNNDFAPFVEFDGTVHKPSKEELEAVAERNEKAIKREYTGQMLYPVTYNRLSEMNVKLEAKKSPDEIYMLTGRIVGMFVDPDSNNDLDECVRLCKNYMNTNEKDCTKEEMDNLIQQGINTLEQSNNKKAF